MPLALVEHAHAGDGVLQRGAHRRGDLRRQRVPVGGGELQRVELTFIECRGQRAHGLVAAGADVGDHPARRDFDVGGQLRAAVAQRFETGRGCGSDFSNTRIMARPARIAELRRSTGYARAFAVRRPGVLSLAGSSVAIRRSSGPFTDV